MFPAGPQPGPPRERDGTAEGGGGYGAGVSSGPGEVAYQPRRADLALGGGGVRGIGLVGAVEVLGQAGYAFPRAVGTSAGAVTAAFIAALGQAGQPVARLGDLLAGFDYQRLAQPDLLGRVPLVGGALDVLAGRPLFRGTYLRSFVTERLADLGVRSFADLRLPAGGADEAGAAGLAPSQRYRLAVTVTDLTNHREAVLPWDLPEYGVDPDGFSVADAVVASAAIPFVFPSVALEPGGGAPTPRAGRSTPAVLVDGGVLDDVPIATLDASVPRPPPWPSFALVPGGTVPGGTVPGAGGGLAGGRVPRSRRLSPVGPLPEAVSLVETLLAGGESRPLAEPCTTARTVRIDASGVSPLDFGISPAQQRQLLDAGREAAGRFLAGWDFDSWLARCGNA